MLTGQLPVKSVSIPVSITITYVCGAATLTPSSIPDFLYQIGTGQKVIQFPDWVDSVGTCGPIAYTVTNGKGALPAYVTFDSNSRSIFISTSSKILNGVSFVVTISGTLSANKATASTSFILSLEEVSASDAAALAEYSDFTSTFSYSTSSNSTNKKKPPAPVLNATITDVDFN